MTIFRTLKPFGKRHRSHISWSLKPGGTLLIFVHGFLGNSLTTWQYFDSFLEREGLEPCDILFWGHSAGRRNIAGPVAQLYELVNKIWDNPLELPHFPSRRAGGFRYSRIVFCGHSMGCVVIRQALLSAFEENKSWASNSDMVLFAPAHRGMSDVLLLSERYFFISDTMSQRAQSKLGIKYLFPAIDQLRPGSTFLKTLEQRTLIALANGGESAAKASLVLHGEMDRIVDWEVAFCGDPQARVIEEQSHSSVCKPFPGGYEDPYLYIRKEVLDD